MIDISIQNIIAWLQAFPAEVASLFTFGVCVIAILGACKGGLAALASYNAFAIVIGNIQVLRLSLYATAPEPIALGTVIFATTYLVSDIITEHYGVRAARQSMFISFFAQLTSMVLMVLCLGHPNITGNFDPALIAEQKEMTHGMMLLFIPSARFFIASILSYVSTQFIDIWIFQFIKDKTHGRFLWLRQNVSLLVSGFLDNMIFSILAWIVLNPTPLSLHTVIVTYILAGYLVRLFVNVMGTPVLYLSYWLIKKDTK